MCGANPKNTVEDIDLLRLWTHENWRVFGDRLVNKKDKGLLEELLNNEISSQYKYKRNDIYCLERLIFIDFMSGKEGENRPYNLIPDIH